MTTQAISTKLQAGATIIDVRGPDEFSSGHYKNAKNIPVGSLLARLSEVGPKDKPVVVYCASGGRSSLAQKLLQANGFTDVSNGGGLSDMP